MDAEIYSWLGSLEKRWKDISFKHIDVKQENSTVHVEVHMHIGEVHMHELQMQLIDPEKKECIVFTHKTDNKACFIASIPKELYAKKDLFLLVLPYHRDMSFPMESSLHWSYENPFEDKLGKST